MGLRTLLLIIVLSLSPFPLYGQNVPRLTVGDRVRVSRTVNGFLRVYDTRLLRIDGSKIIVTTARDTLAFLLADVDRLEKGTVGTMSTRRGIIGALAGGASGLVAGAFIGGGGASDYGPFIGASAGLLFGLVAGTVVGLVTPGTIWSTVYQR